MNDEAGFLAAIHADPDDDTARLAYADWLGENSGSIPCPKCMGTGSHGLDPYELARRYGTHRAGRMLDALRCGVCNGVGTILPDGDRPELARAQAELTKCRPDCGIGKVCRGVYDWPGKMTCAGVRDRERELLAANPHWARAACGECGGMGAKSLVGWNPCPACGGAKDLLQSFIDGRTWAKKPRPVLWRCGHIDGVRVPTLADVWGHPGRLSEGLTPWARAVVRAVPTLTRLVPDDRVPADRTQVNGEWYWFKQEASQYHSWNRPDVETARIPAPVFEEMVGGRKDVIATPFPTPGAAVDALGRALARLARR
jgi:repeat-companion domain TIGR02996